jgi:phenylpropionate dioxygenase-like ring-hydroxylating dioxygenase large terminal subunit
MQRTRQVQLAKRILTHRESKNSTDLAADMYQIDPDRYLDPTVYEDELERVFRRQPLLACMSCDVQNPGDYVTLDILDVPVLVARGEDGVVRAFRNSCRHRGAIVAAGRGHTTSFSCPFHGWSYRCDGSLAATTHRKGFADLDLDSHGLVPLSCGESSGLVFVQLRGTGAELDAAGWLSGLDEEFADYGYQTYHAMPRPTRSVAANWKLLFDGNCESYHVRYLHRTTIHPLIDSDNSVFDSFGPHSLAIYARKTIGALGEVPEADWDFLPHASCTYLIFPNTVLINMVDHVEMFRFFPEAVDRTRVELTLYTPTAATDERSERHWRRQAEALEMTVVKEDVPISEGIQRTLKPGGPPLTFGRNEPALIHFHQGLDRLLSHDRGQC